MRNYESGRAYDFGRLEVTIDEVIEQRNISRNKLTKRAEMNSSQLNSYSRGELVRLDIGVLCRLCYTLDCELSDIIRYVRPKAAE